MKKSKINIVGGLLRRFGTWIESFGKKAESAVGLGDLIEAHTQATRLDRFAEWWAVDILGREGCGCPARKNRLNTLWRFNEPKLIIAIPEYNDRGGLWGMLEHLYWEIVRYGLQDRVELLVVTQTPVIAAPVRVINDFGTPNQKELPPGPTEVIAGPEPLKNYCASLTQRGVVTHYHEYTEKIGTGPAKRACIDFAAQHGAEWVWICDSHLSFIPGSVNRFYKWVRKTKNRNSKHLYHCALMYDNFKDAHTGLSTRKPSKLANIGGDHLWGQWKNEISRFTSDDPIQIESHGGFWMATRVDIAKATFGHPLFKGFGDPETILHEQRKAAGYDIYCLPPQIVGATHRFLKVRHNDFHSPWHSSLRNHIIGVLSLRLHLMKEAVAAGFEEPFEWILASWVDTFPSRRQEIVKYAADAREEFYAWKAEQEKIRDEIMKKQHAKQQIPAAPVEKSMAEVFSDIAKNAKWGSVETVSGPGSTMDATETIRTEIPALMQRLELRSLLDIPCGDHNWMSSVLDKNKWIQYIGGDIAPELIQKNRERFPGRNFGVVDLVSDQLPGADLILVRDGLVHLPHEFVIKAIQNIKASGSRYLLATTFPGRPNKDIQVGQWHPMDLSDKIFGLGQPTELINENCKEGDGQFKDKSLGLWKLN